jgi:small subunit ribosomal protein S24e
LKFETVSEKDNPVLSRREIVVKIQDCGATPSRKDVVAGLAAHFGAAENLILVDQILTEFGTSACRAKLKIYQDEKFIPKQRLGIVKARSKSAQSAEKVAE